ncbi:hypothetical protein BO71DRAFT_211144 [Aspergillus ellipticus CBS 707.79]|uniref:Uncharacterized protein n=1 Tax=Aspergillus ellipticus CBS 707.79 TaxID=1448320 RepID=A0A319EUZ2_9EURO|nr:hypothetical protein BO71DRAFT_211144 [Aspergillus ellipticus CBS 707.79]
MSHDPGLFWPGTNEATARSTWHKALAPIGALVSSITKWPCLQWHRLEPNGPEPRGQNSDRVGIVDTRGRAHTPGSPGDPSDQDLTAVRPQFWTASFLDTGRGWPVAISWLGPRQGIWNPVGRLQRTGDMRGGGGGGVSEDSTGLWRRET